jgi:hypothetical protein
MKSSLGRTLLATSMVLALFAISACNKSSEETNSTPSGGEPPPGFRGPRGKAGPIHEIMVKLAKGPESLAGTMEEELKSDPPLWDKLKPQAKAYVELVASVAKENPPKGSKESWAKLTSAFSNSAVALQKAIDAKDKDGAVAVQKTIAESCMACHHEHKGGKGGFPGKFPPGFGPKGKLPGKESFDPPGKFPQGKE